MAFRAPRYSHVHAGRAVGAAAITTSHALDTDFPKDNIIDDRAGTLCKFAASNVHWFDFDLGASFDTGINRLIIPANHNTTLVRVQEDDNAGFSTPTNLTGNLAQVAGVLIDMEFVTPSSQRYIRVRLNDTQTHSLSQIFLTKIVTLTVGPSLADSPDEKRANVTRLLQSTGLSPTIQNGPQQRYLEYEYEAALEGADLTAMEALVDSVGMSRPFFVDPASFSATPETDDPALWMKFAEMPESRNSVLVPMSNARSKIYRLRLIESLD